MMSAGHGFPGFRAILFALSQLPHYGEFWAYSGPAAD
jgi:hypothetical protein